MNNEHLMDCSSRIKLERQKRSWTQEQLAERAKLSTRTVQRIECGAEASPETLRLLAQAFGLDAGVLRGGKMRTHFDAPWSRSVKVITTLAIGLLLAFCILPTTITRAHWGFGLSANLLAFVVILPSLFLSVNGYSIKGGSLLIHRLGWATKFDLARLSGVEINPRAMMGSIRLFGNGGLFCFVGLFRNAILGNYRAYLTDPAKCVVLELGDRKIVISPDDPQEFVESLHDATKGICNQATAGRPA